MQIRHMVPAAMQNARAAYFGIFAPHVWVYCVAHRSDVDYGSISLSVPLYLALSLCMLIAMLVVWRKRSIPITHSVDWVVAAVMSIATVPLVYPMPFSGTLATVVFASITGFGLAWLYLRWAPFYAKLDIKSAIVCIFVAMAIGSALKIFIDLMPALPATICMILLPPLSILLTRNAEAHQPEIADAPRIYHGESRMSVPWRILIGVAVYSLIIGIIQGLPIAEAFPSEAMVLVHHGSEIAIAFGVLWWVFGRQGLLRFSSLWRAILLFTATGLFFLPVLGAQWASWAIVLVSIAQTLVVMLFWTMLADVAHHSSASPFVIFGSGWIAYSFPFAVGKLLGNTVGTQDGSVYLLTVMTYFLTLAAVFALNESTMAQRRIFADLDMPAPEQSMYASIERGCELLGGQHGLTPREIEVLQLLCKGRSKSYIAETLFISENTVRSHSKHIYQKLDVHSKQEALDLVTRIQE